MLKSSIKINCRPYNSNSRTKAFIDLVMDETLVIKGFTLVEWENRLFLSFPSKKEKDDYHDTVYSLDKEWTKSLEKACITKYREAINKSDNSDKTQFS